MQLQPVTENSSALVTYPVMAFNVVVCLICAFFRYFLLSKLFAAVFAAGFISRKWAEYSGKDLDLRIRVDKTGVFPGNRIRLTVEAENKKTLPVFWMELVCPLDLTHCLLPEETEEPGEWEKPHLRELDASVKLQGILRLKTLFWNETEESRIELEAKRRGCLVLDHMSFRTGDGFGLCQVRVPVSIPSRVLYVYPKLQPVRSDLFLRNYWNLDTGSSGYVDDPTLIRSTRPYEPSDNVKQINWKLMAKGFPLSVNLYEKIRPKNILFLFDSESFSGLEKHPEEMEDALSVLVSLLLLLDTKKIHCALGVCRGKGMQETIVHSLKEALYLTARIRNEEDRFDDENHLLQSRAVFDVAGLLKQSQDYGRIYYFLYSMDRIMDSSFQKVMSEKTTSFISCVPNEKFGNYEVVDIAKLKG